MYLFCVCVCVSQVFHNILLYFSLFNVKVKMELVKKNKNNKNNRENKHNSEKQRKISQVLTPR